MRLFIGIPMAEAVIHELASIRAHLERPGDGLRWSAPESWHITLQFLGNTAPDQYQCTVAGLRTLTSPLVPIKLDRLGFFDRAGVFFASVLLSPELIALQRRVVAATAQCGFIPETRPYHPHITLARVRGQSNGIRQLKTTILPEPRFPAFAVREFLLYESFPNSAGSRYEIRERFIFAA
ncbi:MAG TPA: RNA 2',3'-cyclic phosphodiesterase [Terracidiphilus sp.]|jgi:2'-5' RNA ligase|nr:RNA 2',3'-cyclic phosphodiesterase [Terracidiphilus sp.]